MTNTSANTAGGGMAVTHTSTNSVGGYGCDPHFSILRWRRVVLAVPNTVGPVGTETTTLFHLREMQELGNLGLALSGTTQDWTLEEGKRRGKSSHIIIQSLPHLAEAHRFFELG